MKKFVVGLLLVFLLTGCTAATVTASEKSGGGAGPAVQEEAENLQGLTVVDVVPEGEIVPRLSLKEFAALTDEQKAEYWLRRAVQARFAEQTTARASVAQAYYLKLIYHELKRQNELLAKTSEGRGD